QAEDGIRDKLVTGVQTCALPICVKIPFSCTVPGHCSAASGPPLARRVPRYCILRRAARLSVCSMPYVNTPRKARLESNRPAQTACDGLHDKIGRASCRERV